MSLDKLNFQEILEQLVKGDEKSFDQLFTHFYPGLVRYARSLLSYAGNEAEDIVSDVFCSIWINRESLQIRDSIASYLYRAVKNKVINHYKKGKLSVVDIAEAAHDVDVQSHQLPDQLMSFKQFNERINYLVGQLPEKTRIVFMMSREEGLSYEQIAEMMDVSINTIKTHMFRAIRFLKEAFNANDYLNLIALGLISVFS